MMSALVKKNRSYRRFHEEESLDYTLLEKFVDLAHLTASGANKQALRYYISSTKEYNEKIFPQLRWAGYLKEWDGPSVGERPGGYIILLQNTTNKIGSPYDVGIAAQTILLGAVEKDLGGCILANINREKIKTALQLPDDFEVLLVIALGKPKEQVVIDEITADDDIKYWRDENHIHHVPKIKLADVIIK